MGGTRSDGQSRRGFLAVGASLAGALTLGGRRASAAGLERRKLGRTGLEVGVISFGGGLLSDRSHVRLLEEAIDRGVNLIHVGPDYGNGRALRIVGEVLARRRDSVYLALQPPNEERQVDGVLRSLNTEYADILVPALIDPSGIGNPAILEALGRLKQKGKIRFCGFSCGHGRTVDILNAAVESGFWDCVLLRYNLGTQETFDPIVAEAVERHGMGFLAMKSTQNLARASAEIFAAGLRKLLENPRIASLTVGMDTLEHLAANLAAVGTRNARADRELRRYVATWAGGFCDSCGRCEAACAQGVAVTEFLRADLYRERGDPALCRRVVETIPARRSLAVCTSCGQCNAACRRRIDVLGRIRGAATPAQPAPASGTPS